MSCSLHPFRFVECRSGSLPRGALVGWVVDSSTSFTDPFSVVQYRKLPVDIMDRQGREGFLWQWGSTVKVSYHR